MRDGDKIKLLKHALDRAVAGLLSVEELDEIADAIERRGPSPTFEHFPEDNQPSYFYVRDFDGRPVGVVSLVFAQRVGAVVLLRAAAAFQHPNDEWRRKRCVDKAVGRLLARSGDLRVTIHGDDPPPLLPVLRDLGFKSVERRIDVHGAAALWAKQVEFVTKRVLATRGPTDVGFSPSRRIVGER